MATAALVLAGLGTAVQAASSIASGNATRAMDTNQAAQLAQQAGEARAASQRQAVTDQRSTAFALSRAQALAASGGGNTSDAGVANIEGNIAGQGEYNSLTALYNGEQKARGLDTSAQDKLISGQNAFDAGEIGAGGALIKGGSTLFTNYGNGGPDTSPADSGFYGPSNLPWQNVPGYS